MVKAPFLVFPEFISPLLAEDIVSNIDVRAPDTFAEGDPKHEEYFDEEYDEIIAHQLSNIMPSIENHFNFECKTVNPITIEHCGVGSHVPVHAEGYELIEKQFVKTKPWDFTAVLFLTSHIDEPPIDEGYECHGGKLEFLNHKFGFNPTAGTLIVFPTDPRFTNATGFVKIGDLFQIRIQISSATMYLYNPKLFPGDFTKWF
jgi:hypothetical protein